MLFRESGHAYNQGNTTQGVGAYAWVLSHRQWILVLTAVGMLSVLQTPFLLMKKRPGLAFISSGMGIIGLMASIGCLMYPYILPSSTDAKSSLMVTNSSSSHMTLFIMFISALIFMPIVLTYTAWVYRVLKGPVTSASVKKDMNSY